MKRFTATEKWQKDWFQSLSPGQKCLWNYLCDNCDAGGVWEPNWRLASFVINETFTAESLTVFGERIRILPDGKIWLTGFCEFQYSHLSRECRAHIHILRILEKHHLLHEVEHLIAGGPDNPSDTLWHRVADRDKEKDKDKVKEPERDSADFAEEILSRPRPGPEFAETTAAAPVAAVADDSRASAAPEFLAFPGGVALSGVKTRPSSAAKVLPFALDGGRAKIPPWPPEVAVLSQRIGAIMRRRPGSRWSERELAALKAVFPLAEDDLALIERYYAAEISSAEDIRRRDLLTLLNNWPGELDRARLFWRKRGWKLPVENEERAMPEGFAEWKAQAAEYNGTAWSDWASVPAFAKDEFRRWRAT